MKFKLGNIYLANFEHVDDKLEGKEKNEENLLYGILLSKGL